MLLCAASLNFATTTCVMIGQMRQPALTNDENLNLLLHMAKQNFHSDQHSKETAGIDYMSEEFFERNGTKIAKEIIIWSILKKKTIGLENDVVGREKSVVFACLILALLTTGIGFIALLLWSRRAARSEAEKQPLPPLLIVKRRSNGKNSSLRRACFAALMATNHPLLFKDSERFHEEDCVDDINALLPLLPARRNGSLPSRIALS